MDSPVTDRRVEHWLQTTIPLDEDFIRCPNLAAHLTSDEKKALGALVVEDFERDRVTRYEWEKRNDNALQLAMQVTAKKTFPWEGAANVKFPLITTAALQYSSRAYPALVNGSMPVAAKPILPRPNFKLPIPLQMLAAQLSQNPQAASANPQAQQQLQQAQQQARMQMMQWKHLEDRSDRIARHMSWQLLEEDVDWEEHHDRLLLIQCILGCAFKKTYFDPIQLRNISECISPRDLIISYYTKSIESAPRVSEIIYLSANEIYERVARNLFCELDADAPPAEPQLTYMYQELANAREGLVQQPGDHQAPFECIEQHTYLDLDGDGYAEPVTITVRYDTKQLLRVVARFTRNDITYSHDGKVLRIEPIVAYTKYGFIPSPDGGFYDLGFGALLGPLNETIDSAINQLLDAGTLANAGGGFLGRGFRNKKGELRIRPGEWHTVDTTGDDLRKAVLPLPMPQPSSTLFDLLRMLIEYAEGIAGAVDILQGKNPGQNTPAETSRAMVEQGMKVFNGIYKRTHRAFTQEIRKLYRLNRIFITEESPWFVTTTRVNPYTKSMAKDYAGADIVVEAGADPFYMSDAQRYNQSLSIQQLSMQSPGFNHYEVSKYMLQALKAPHIDAFLPDPEGPFAVPPPPNPKVQVEQIKLQGTQMKEQLNFKIKLLELVSEAEKNQAVIKELNAKAAFESAQAAGVADGHKIALFEAQVGAAKAKQEGLIKAIELMHQVMGGTGGQGDEGGSGGDDGMAGTPSNSSPQGNDEPQGA